MSNIRPGQRAPTVVEYLQTLLSVVAILGVTAFTISVVILILRIDLAAKLLGHLQSLFLRAFQQSAALMSRL
jgi:hypothetical protein